MPLAVTVGSWHALERNPMKWMSLHRAPLQLDNVLVKHVTAQGASSYITYVKVSLHPPTAGTGVQMLI
jgi:hypothetical protein